MKPEYSVLSNSNDLDTPWLYTESKKPAGGDPKSGSTMCTEADVQSEQCKRLGAALRVIEFTVPNVGGGFIAIDALVAGHCAGGIRLGAIGKHYATLLDAREDAMELASAMTKKCKGNKLDFGGCKTVLYFHDESLVTSPMEVGSPRALLFNGLAEALAPVIDRILCGPDMNTTFRDLGYLRARCCQLYPTMTKNPIPHEMTTESSLVATATAYGLYGALTTLAKKKGWGTPSAAIQGMGAVGGQVYDLLRKDGWTLYAGDINPMLVERVPDDFRLSSEEIVCEPCDVFVPCAMGGVLSLSNIEKLQCKAVAGCANLQIPVEAMDECTVALSNRGIEYYDEVLLNGGGVQSAIMSFRCEKFENADAIKMCARNMEVMILEQSVVTQYDTEEHKRTFLASVLGEKGSGLWEDVCIEKDGPFGGASVKMTEYMWKQALDLTPSPSGAAVSYVDLGAGTGSAARHIVESSPSVHATCLNLCPRQNRENRESVAAMGLEDRVTVVDGTFECMPEEWSGTFDGVFSQDAFMHAFSKKNALSEAKRIVKGGGWLVVSDVHSGDNVSEEQVKSFTQTNMVNDWLTPDAMVALAREVGWVDAQFVDLTAHIKRNTDLMLKKVTDVIASGQHAGVHLSLLESYHESLEKRNAQIDSGVFKWGALLARKPFEVFFASPSAVVEESVPAMVSFLPASSDLSASVDVVVVTAEDGFDVDFLPASTRCIIAVGDVQIDAIKAGLRGITVQPVASLSAEQVVRLVLTTLAPRELIALNRSNVRCEIKNSFLHFGEERARGTRKARSLSPSFVQTVGAARRCSKNSIASRCSKQEMLETPRENWTTDIPSRLPAPFVCAYERKFGEHAASYEPAFQPYVQQMPSAPVYGMQPMLPPPMSPQGNAFSQNVVVMQPCPVMQCYPVMQFPSPRQEHESAPRFRKERPLSPPRSPPRSPPVPKKQPRKPKKSPRSQSTTASQSSSSAAAGTSLFANEGSRAMLAEHVHGLMVQKKFTDPKGHLLVDVYQEIWADITGTSASTSRSALERFATFLNGSPDMFETFRQHQGVGSTDAGSRRFEAMVRLRRVDDA